MATFTSPPKASSSGIPSGGKGGPRNKSGSAQGQKIDWAGNIGTNVLGSAGAAFGNMILPGFGGVLGKLGGNLLGKTIFGEDLPQRPRIKLRYDIGNGRVKILNQENYPGAPRYALMQLGQMANLNLGNTLSRLNIDPSIRQYDFGAFQSRAGFAIPELGEGLYKNININGKAKEGRAWGPKGERVSYPSEGTLQGAISAAYNTMLETNVRNQYAQNPNYFMPRAMLSQLGLGDIKQSIPSELTNARAVSGSDLMASRQFVEGKPKWGMAMLA